MWFPSIVKPIVSENAIFCIFVIRLAIWAPYCLKMEIVKVDISIEFIDEVDAYLYVVVCERTEFPVLTLRQVLQERLAKAGFVLVRMVKFLDTRVAVNASVALRTLFLLRYVAAKFRSVRVMGTSSVFEFFVIVRTLLQIVTWFLNLGALLSLEVAQIKSLNKMRLRSIFFEKHVG
jgi:hypothetical protein